MFLLKFFIVLLFSYMVQTSDSCNHDNINNAAQSRTAAQNKTGILYCAANAVQRNAQILQDFNLSVATNNPVASIILNKTFQQFSNKCKDFTLAMSLKHQLQNYLFTQNNSNLTSDQISRLSSILIYLQTVANSLDDIHSRQQSSNCVRLSAHGYRMMYHVKFNTTSLLTEMNKQGRLWVNDENYKNGDSPCICEVLYPPWK